MLSYGNETSPYPVLSVSDLHIHFSISSGILRKPKTLHAVDGISFDIGAQELFSLVGESGCGKSTTARAIMRLIDPTAGSIAVEGKDVTAVAGPELREFRRRVQMIFQDPFSSLDPRMKVVKIIEEPLLIHGLGNQSERARRSAELMELVGLGQHFGDRHPHELSGGQRQRVGIARALALSPRLIICDEPVSALDVSVRAQIVNLLEDLRETLGLTMLFISHDLSLVRHLSDRVAVMYLGRIVESGPRDALFETPRHPYTMALLSAIPVPDPKVERNRRRSRISGEIPSPITPPSGCTFRTRCPFAAKICAEEVPAPRPISGNQKVACHRAEEIEVSKIR